MPFGGPMADRLAIRELIETYSDAVCRRDMVAWGATWTDDAVWGSRDGALSGREAIVARCAKVLDGLGYIQFRALPGAIEVQGDTAQARTYVHTTRTTASGELQIFEATYLDTLRRTPDGWRFSGRDIDQPTLHRLATLD